MNTRRTDAVTASGLRVRRGGHTVLHDLDLSIGAGSITGLLGPSGSGKSTLIRAVVGSQRVDSGTVSVLGEPAGSPGLRTRVGYTTQSPSVYPDLSVEQNLRYVGALTGAVEDAIARTLAEVGLDGVRRRRVRQLSGGQRHRVSLACSLVGDPDLLVLDEPTVGLDPALREDIWDRLEARRDAGATILVSSHVMEEATRCDALLLLREGRLLFQGTPADLRERTDTDDLDRAFLAIIRETR